jgi:hypothetical protein
VGSSREGEKGGRGGRGGGGGESGMGCFWSRHKDAKAPATVVVEPQRPELGLWHHVSF